MSTINPDTAYDPTYAAIARERTAQDAKWGEQNHPDGTGPDTYVLGVRAHAAASAVRHRCQRKAREGTVTWFDIALEEFCEAVAESDPDKLRGELVQVAAVCVAWAQAIERRPVR